MQVNEKDSGSGRQQQQRRASGQPRPHRSMPSNKERETIMVSPESACSSRHTQLMKRGLTPRERKEAQVCFATTTAEGGFAEDQCHVEDCSTLHAAP